MAISTKQSSQRSDRHAPRAGAHAIVIGASMAGLLTARVLADSYDRVTVLDRDRLPTGLDEHRRAVPQGRHAHGLQPGGQQAIEHLLPGFTDEATQAGAPLWRPGVDMRFDINGSFVTKIEAGRPSTFASRPFLEGIVRRRVAAIPNVSLREQTSVMSLLHHGGRVRGVALRDRAAGSHERELRADLVVAATGRGGRVPAWLEEMGYERPAEDRVDVDIMYASRNMRLRPGALGHDKIVLVAPRSGRPRSLAMLVDEHGTWKVTLNGYGEAHHPPTDSEGWMAFAASIADPEVAAELARAEPVNEIVSFAYPASVRRRYEKLRRFPAGLLVTGDAICSFNPIYGQGMTIAAMEAVALQRCLHKGGDRLAKRFFKAVAGTVDQAWKLSAGGDLALDEVAAVAPLPDRIVGRYMERLTAATAHDKVVARTFLEVTGMVKPLSALLTPAMMRRVLRGSRRPAQAAGQPALATGAEASATA
jgi:2-polyprenyl-6-methoxyphenol hydroxylase-like FAD-dependent oxidoreductase